MDIVSIGLFSGLFSIGVPLMWAMKLRHSNDKIAYLLFGVATVAVACLLILGASVQDKASRFAQLCQDRMGTFTTEDLSYVCSNNNSDTSSMETSMLAFGALGDSAFLIYLGAASIGIIGVMYLGLQALRKIIRGDNKRKH